MRGMETSTMAHYTRELGYTQITVCSGTDDDPIYVPGIRLTPEQARAAAKWLDSAADFCDQERDLNQQIASLAETAQRHLASLTAQPQADTEPEAQPATAD
jgi:hypothetical protein